MAVEKACQSCTCCRRDNGKSEEMVIIVKRYICAYVS